MCACVDVCRTQLTADLSKGDVYALQFRVANQFLGKGQLELI